MMRVRGAGRDRRVCSAAGRRVWVIAAACVALAAGVSWAVGQARTPSEDDKVRAASRQYYGAIAAGDVQTCLAVSRQPVTVISNGVARQRTEAQLRSLLASVAKQTAANPLTPEERTRVEQHLAEMFQEADVTFIGADTAAVAFLMRPGMKPDEGDLIAMLILHRDAGEWRVIAEVRDDNPVPRSYLPQPPLPPPANGQPPPGASPAPPAPGK